MEACTQHTNSLYTSAGDQIHQTTEQAQQTDGPQMQEVKLKPCTRVSLPISGHKEQGLRGAPAIASRACATFTADTAALAFSTMFKPSALGPPAAAIDFTAVGGSSSSSSRGQQTTADHPPDDHPPASSFLSG